MKQGLTLGAKGLALVEAKEGFRAKMYYDSNKLPTIGFGTLIDQPDEQYLLTAIITREQAEQLLRKDMLWVFTCIDRYVNVQLNQNQYDALCVLIYNIGTDHFRKSSVCASINAQAPLEQIHTDWCKWRYADGEPVLLARREEEFNLYKS